LCVGYDEDPSIKIPANSLGESPVTIPMTGRCALCALFLSLFAAVGCGGDSPDITAGTGAAGPSVTSGAARPRLIFITNGSSDWWTTVEKGMHDGAKEFGAQVEMRRVEGEPAAQIQRIEDVISLPDVQGVAISVLEADSPGIADKVRELQSAGKIVIAIDSDGQKDARRAYIGTFNRKAGEVAGKVARLLRPQGGKTVAFVGTAAAANASERRQGFFVGAGDGFRISPQQDALEVLEDGTDKTKAQSNVQTAISKYPEAGVYLGLWSYNAHFIAEEIAKYADLRKKVTIVTFDLDEAAVDDLAKGAIDVTVCQNPYEMGYLGVRLLKALIAKDQKTIDEMLPAGTDSIDTRVRVIVPTKDSAVKGDNVIDINEMKKWLASKGLKSS
jgi:ribose transport system substrate-binding protein